MRTMLKSLFFGLLECIPVVFFLGAIIVSTTGCTTKPAPVVEIKYVPVVVQDNLLVDCEVAKPPKKEDYLKETPVSLKIADPDTSLNLLAPLADQSKDYVIAQLQSALKIAQERERQQSQLNMKHYQNVAECNVRWKAVREHKARTIETLNQPRSP